MSDPTAFDLADQFREALLKQERTAAVRLVNAYGATYQRLQGQIDALVADLDAMVANGQELTAWKVGRLERLKNLKVQIADEVGRYAAVVENEMDQGAQQAVQMAQQHAKALTAAALPGVAPIDAAIMAQWQSLNPGAVQSMLGFLSDGSPLRTMLRERMGPDLADLVGQKLVEGIALGYNPRKVAAIFQREMGQGLTWSLRTARTAQLNAYRESTRAAYMANSEIVPRYRRRCARGTNTCMSCIALDGTEYPVTERLTDHHAGRCVAIPVTVTYRDLGLNVDEPPPVIKDTAQDWYRGLPEAKQKQMMGRDKWKVWKTGAFDLGDMSTEVEDKVWGKMNVEKTLKDLVKVEEKAA